MLRAAAVVVGIITYCLPRDRRSLLSLGLSLVFSSYLGNAEVEEDMDGKSLRMGERGLDRKSVV